MPYENQDGPKMESAKQEKYDLLHDNPVAKDASGGRPWIAKHFKSTMGGSPVKHYDTSKGSHSHPHDMSKGPEMNMKKEVTSKPRKKAEKK